MSGGTKATQTTNNNQATGGNDVLAVTGANAKRGGAIAAPGGVSIVLNTGGNKIKSSKGSADAGGKRGKGGKAGSASGNDAYRGSGDVTINTTVTDEGAIAHLSEIADHSIEALGYIAHDASANAGQVAQAGADFAAIAFPTGAALQVAGNLLNPQLINDGGGDQQPPPLLTDNEKTILILVGIGLSLWLLLE